MVTGSVHLLKLSKYLVTKWNVNAEWNYFSVSEGYESMFLNWLQWYKRLKLDMEVILIAEDRYIEEKYAKDKFVTMIYHDFQQVVSTIQEN